jgi:hypothetical protein
LLTGVDYAPWFEVPELPNPVVINAVYLHPQEGLYILEEPVHCDTSRLFFMTAEAPGVLRRGEQVGVRLGLFNNWDQSLEVFE